MAVFQSSFLTLCLLFFLLQTQPSHSLKCTSQKFTQNRLYQFCNDLPHLRAYLHWSYNSAKSSLNLAFLAPPAKPSGWVAWAINPNGTGMVGAQALIAFRQSDGSMTVETFKLNSYKSVEQTKIAYKVSNLEAEYENGLMMIFATVMLPEKMVELNQVWQVGSSVMNGTMPAMHAFQTENLNSKGRLDLLKGQSSTNNGGNSGLRNRNIHGILNAASWGIMFPVGIIIARYIRTFADPAWFYLHVACQVSGYVVGVAGWATGLKLGSQSKGVEYTSHRYIGITLFCLATLQVFALFLRPKKDHKFRFYWNMYHHGVGYAVLVLGIVNVFKGLEILHPAKKWKVAYIIFLASLGVIALFLEVVTWIVVLKRKPGKPTKPYDGLDGSNGRQQPLTS
ncbi:hypothetical protein F0562_035255 [Nyssa sinensis]|uniref:Cytochrome b561 and DOMON domain-containing protein n=1 Tax=Nyssa sinensis TaxID=561372 RepID=A0A5J5ADS5_9ASTE|nr:hypothetical protein F0562_035255 [Nyssa sinensis]